MKKTFITPAVKVTAMETQNMICTSIVIGGDTAQDASQSGWTLNSKAAGMSTFERLSSWSMGKLEF